MRLLRQGACTRSAKLTCCFPSLARSSRDLSDSRQPGCSGRPQPSAALSIQSSATMERAKSNGTSHPLPSGG